MDTSDSRRRWASMLGAALLVAGAVVGGQLAVGAVLASTPRDGPTRTTLSPYRDGAFTVRAAAVDARVGIAGAEDGSYVLGHTPAGGDVVLDLGLLAGEAARPWWVEPSTGRTLQLADVASEGVARFPVPDGDRTVWVLVIDDVDAGYGTPDVGTIVAAVSEAMGSAGPARDAAGPDAGVGAGDAAGRASGASRDGSAEDRDGSAGGRDDSGRERDPDERTGEKRGGETRDRAEDAATGTGGTSGGADDPAAAPGNPGTAGDAPASGTAPEDREFPAGAAGDEPGTDTPDRAETADSAKEGGSETPAGPGPPADTPKKDDTPKDAGGPEPRPAADAAWDRLAHCESSGDWAISTGNGYYGGLQFDEPTWREFGGTRYAPTADGASRKQQIEIATKVRDTRGGYGSWPACARELGLPR